MEFFDTNILVYAVDEADPARRRIAEGLLRQSMGKGVATISTQVMLEFYSAVRRRKLLNSEGIALFLQGFAAENVVAAHPDFIWKAFETQARYGFSIWDAAIVQGALDGGCDVLYTEDLQHGQQIGPLQVVNPFRSHSVHEPPASYPVKRKPASRRG